METYIPPKEARTFIVRQGGTLAVVAADGKQVADLTAVAEDDHSIAFSSHITANRAGRSLRRAETLYAGPPTFSPLLKVTQDDVGSHWIHSRCTRLRFPENCHDHLVAAFAKAGVAERDVPLSTFNIFMAVDVDADGHYSYREPEVEQGQSIVFSAERDVIVGISACPDATIVNAYECKGLTVVVG